MLYAASTFNTHYYTTNHLSLIYLIESNKTTLIITQYRSILMTCLSLYVIIPSLTILELVSACLFVGWLVGLTIIRNTKKYGQILTKYFEDVP